MMSPREGLRRVAPRALLLLALLLATAVVLVVPVVAKKEMPDLNRPDIQAAVERAKQEAGLSGGGFLGGADAAGGGGPARGGRRAPSPPRELVVVGYMPEYRFGALGGVEEARAEAETAAGEAEADAVIAEDAADGVAAAEGGAAAAVTRWGDAFLSGRVTHAILFSVEVNGETGELQALDRLDSVDVSWATTTGAATAPRFLVCVGGGGRSGGFSAAVADASRRGRLVASIGELLVERGLAGVDLDWEGPASLADWVGYLRLVTELRAALGEDVVLSLALHPGQEGAFANEGLRRAVDVDAALEALSLLHVMAYDMGGGDRHSPIRETAAAVQRFLAAGVPPERLTVGIPFYGRHETSTEPRPWVDMIGPAARDGKAKAQVVSGLSKTDVIAKYHANSPRTVRLKVRMAHDLGLAGVMVWELGHDAPRGNPLSLLDAIAEETRAVAAGEEGILAELGRRRPADGGGRGGPPGTASGTARDVRQAAADARKKGLI